MTFEVRYNEDGSVDEIVGDGPFQLEQMAADEWLLYLDGARLFLFADTDDYEPVVRAGIHEIPVPERQSNDE